MGDKKIDISDRPPRSDTNAYMRWYRKSSKERYKKTREHSDNWKKINPEMHAKYQNEWRNKSGFVPERRVDNIVVKRDLEKMVKAKEPELISHNKCSDNLQISHQCVNSGCKNKSCSFYI